MVTIPWGLGAWKREDSLPDEKCFTNNGLDTFYEAFRIVLVETLDFLSIRSLRRQRKENEISSAYRDT